MTYFLKFMGISLIIFIILLLGQFSLSVKKEQKEKFVLGILLANEGPMSVKYLQNLLAISKWSVIILPSDINAEGKDCLVFRLLITSFTSLHVNFLNWTTFYLITMTFSFVLLKIHTKWSKNINIF